MSDQIVPSEANYEQLVSAVFARAILDYERALCRKSNSSKRVISEVETMADGSETLSAILDRVHWGIKALNQLIESCGVDIVSWSDNTRRQKGRLPRPEYMPFRCPLCGGGLYAVRHSHNGFRSIRCTHCHIEGRFNENEEY